MAYYPKNKAKIKPSKEGDFIYQDDKTPFNGNYIQTSKDQYYEGDNINSPGRVIIPTQRRQRKNQLLGLLKNLLSQLFNTFIIQQLLNELLSTLLNPGDIFNIEQLLGLLNDAEGRELTEEEKNRAQELLDQIESDEIVGIDNSVINSSIYNNLKPGIFSNLNNNESPIATKVRPTDEDYNKGSYIRYFSKRNNSISDYFEINESTYNSISLRKTQFDINLYEVFNIRWSLGENAREINTNRVSRYERLLPGVQTLFNNPTEFARVIQSNLTTTGNELFFEDGTEYIGEYHIHPIQGPMVGAVHIQEPHAKLYYSYELGTPKDEFIPQEIIPESQQVGLFRIIGGNKYYIRENKFGIFAEVIDTITEPQSSIYTSRIYLKTEISPEDLIEIAIEETQQGITLNQPPAQITTSSVEIQKTSEQTIQPQLQPQPQPVSQPTYTPPTSTPSIRGSGY
jgi:hypothetical protein